MRRANRGGRVGRTAKAGRVGAVALAALLAGCAAAPPRTTFAPVAATNDAVFAAPATTPAAEPAPDAALAPAPAVEPLAYPLAAPASASFSDLFATQQDRPTPPMDTRMSYERGPSEAFNWNHFCFDAAYIPAMWVTADVDQHGASGTRGDLETGDGASLRAGFGSVSQNIGVLWIGTWHDEQTTGRGASTQQYLVDFLYRAPIPDMNNLIWLEVDGGLGAVDLHFNSPALESEVTGSALLHGDLEFRLGKSLWINIGGGGFIWGHFGDTVAYGSYVDIGAKLIF